MSRAMRPLRAPAGQSISLLARGLNVQPLADALDANPQLWNAHRQRTADETSPHRDLADIWCRFAPAGAGGDIPHRSVWYPAADHLPVRGMARDLMHAVAGVELGGILITRIPPGAKCHPHRDIAWHAQHYSKFAVQVRAAPGQAFCFEDRQLVTEPGDLYSFRNERLHWVVNDSACERITLIVCIRIDD